MIDAAARLFYPTLAGNIRDWGIFTFIPVLVLAAHHYGHFHHLEGDASSSNVGGKRRGTPLERSIYKYAGKGARKYLALFALLAALSTGAIVCVTQAADPETSFVSPALYVATAVTYATHVIALTTTIICVFHGSDPGVTKTVAMLFLLPTAIGLLVISIWMYVEFPGPAPVEILYALIIFAVQTLCALYFTKFVWGVACKQERRHYAYGEPSCSGSESD